MLHLVSNFCGMKAWDSYSSMALWSLLAAAACGHKCSHQSQQFFPLLHQALWASLAFPVAAFLQQSLHAPNSTGTWALNAASVSSPRPGNSAFRQFCALISLQSHELLPHVLLCLPSHTGSLTPFCCSLWAPHGLPWHRPGFYRCCNHTSSQVTTMWELLQLLLVVLCTGCVLCPGVPHTFSQPLTSLASAAELVIHLVIRKVGNYF